MSFNSGFGTKIQCHPKKEKTLVASQQNWIWNKHHRRRTMIYFENMFIRLTYNIDNCQQTMRPFLRLPACSKFKRRKQISDNLELSAVL